MIQVRLVNRRILLLPDSLKFLKKKMQILITSTLLLMNVLLIMNWGIMGRFLLMMQVKVFQILKAMLLQVKLL